MILGPNQIFQCPTCKSLIESSSLISGNTIGAKRYTDNKIEAPRLPDFPNLIRCNGCKDFIWLLSQDLSVNTNGVKKLLQIGVGRHLQKRLSLSEFLEFLDFTQDLKFQDELNVRMMVLWIFNDRVRQKILHFNTNDEEMSWNWNIVRLLELLDWNKSESRLLAAELMRYFEEWDFAIEILNSINESRLHPFGIRILDKCKEKANLVFQF